MYSLASDAAAVAAGNRPHTSIFLLCVCVCLASLRLLTFAKFIQCSAVRSWRPASSAIWEHSLTDSTKCFCHVPSSLLLLLLMSNALQDMLLVKRFVFTAKASEEGADTTSLPPIYQLFLFLLLSLLPLRIRIDKLNQEFLVYFVATSLGQIYKIVQFMHYGQRHSNLVDIFEASPRNEPIRELTLSQKTASLYLATDHQVKQIDLAMCARRYDSCFRCVADPYCGWDKEVNACRPYQLGLLQDVANETSGICDTSVLRKRVTSSYGQTLHLSCFVKMPDVLRKKQTRWYHHSTEKGR